MDDATLQAYLDGELPPDQARAVEDAADTLPHVARRLGQLAALEREVGSYLGALDVPPDMDGAQERLLDAWRVRKGGARPMVRRTAAVALAIVTLGGAVLAAEPVRSWLARTHEPAAEVADPVATTDAADAVLPPGTESPAPEARTELSVVAFAGGLEVRFDGVAPGSDVLVERVEAGMPALRAPPAATFRTGAGLLAMTGGHGPIVVRVPRALQRVQVSVDGQVVLELQQDSVTQRAAGVERDGDDIRFVIREP